MSISTEYQAFKDELEKLFETGSILGDYEDLGQSDYFELSSSDYYEGTVYFNSDTNELELELSGPSGRFVAKVSINNFLLLLATLKAL